MSGRTAGSERAWCVPGLALAVMLVSGCAPTPPAAAYEAQIQREGVDRGILPLIDPDQRRIGFMTQAGDVLIEPTFEGVGYFSEGIAPVRLGDRWGYVDKKGELVLAVRYAYAHPFRDGLALVRLGAQSPDEQWAFIDHRGEVVIGPEVLEDYILLGFFSEGLAPAVPRGSDSWGYLDKAGELAIDDDWEGVSPFSGGLAHVFTDGNHQSGFIDRRGRMTFGAKRLSSKYVRVDATSDGLALIIDRKSGKHGLADRHGRVLIEPGFAQIGEFSEGLASATLRDGDKSGFIDRRGTFVISPRFHGASAFFEGRAMVSRCAGDRFCEYHDFGYVDRQGELVIPFRPYVDAREFSYGYARVKVGKRGLPETHRRGYIDRTGCYLIEPEFYRATSFVYGLAVAERLTPNRYTDLFLIDTRGNRLPIDRVENVLSLYYPEQPTLME